MTSSIFGASIACLAIATAVPAAAQLRPAKIPVIRPAPVPKESFAAHFLLGRAQCSGDYSRATVPVTARVVLPPSMASTTKLSYAVHVDGASTGSTTASVRRDSTGKSYFDVARTLTLRTAGAETLLRLYVEGRAFGAVQTVATPCRLRGTTDSRTMTNPIVYPDLAPGPFVIAEYAPPRPPETHSSWPFAPRLSAGRPFGFRSSVLIESDRRRTLELWRQTRSSCPSESDAFITMRFYIAIVADGTSAEHYFPHERTRYFPAGSIDKIEEAPGYYLDTRGGSPTAPTGERSLPSGYEWAVFDRVLPCTRNGIFEFHIDRDNRLRESDETNNVLRMRYATAPPE